MGALFEQRTDLVFSLIATGVIALVFQPLREKLQHIVNRMMYGKRDTPYQVVSRLGRQLERTSAPEHLLDTITQTVAEALKLPFAGIALLENARAYHAIGVWLASCQRPLGPATDLPAGGGGATDRRTARPP